MLPLARLGQVQARQLWRTIARIPVQQQQQRFSQAPPVTVFRSARRWSSNSSAPSLSSESPQPSPTEPRLSLTFTCTVSSCNGTRSSHTFTKRAYERGVVLIECPGCRNRHLIADHLGWFKDGTADGKNPTIEDILKARGERFIRNRLDGAGGVTEYVD